MKNMNIDTEPTSEEIPQHAVSLYGQGEGVEDFPVLKAFQQYIDAEQEKARRRIIGLGIFFGAILIVVVSVFMILLHGINARNQSLSDRLVEYAMKESERRQTVQPIVAPVPAQNDAALKAMTAALSAIQKKMEATEKKEETKATDKEVRNIDAERQLVKLQRAKSKLDAERRLLDEERERLRKIEIEQQRRKLYPELYEDRAMTRTKSPSRTRTLTDDDIREIIKEVYPESESKKTVTPASDTKKTKAREKDADKDDDAVDDDDAIEYFKDDEYNIPVDVKGSGGKVSFTVPY